jgi:hypothetical protein
VWCFILRKLRLYQNLSKFQENLGIKFFTIEVQSMLFEKRKEKAEAAQDICSRPPRYNCVARVGINGFEGEAALKNISTGGFLMQSRTYVAIRVGEHYTMRLKPEDASGIKLFELEVEVRWVQSTETSFSAGFLIVKQYIDRVFEKYIEYIKNR